MGGQRRSFSFHPQSLTKHLKRSKYTKRSCKCNVYRSTSGTAKGSCCSSLCSIIGGAPVMEAKSWAPSAYTRTIDYVSSEDKYILQNISFKYDPVKRDNTNNISRNRLSRKEKKVDSVIITCTACECTNELSSTTNIMFVNERDIKLQGRECSWGGIHARHFPPLLKDQFCLCMHVPWGMPEWGCNRPWSGS